ncbi:MAG: CoA-binding protein [Candidatus Bathyarchaeia archaeon]
MELRADLIREILERKNVIAVVGASRDPEKYGHRVYGDLKEAGYAVYPVNPNAAEILGDRCYPDLKSLPVKPDVVNVVVPPEVTEDVVKSCKELGITKVWMQPGSESEKAIEYCEANGIDVVYGVCIMVERRKR